MCCKRRCGASDRDRRGLPPNRSIDGEGGENDPETAECNSFRFRQTAHSTRAGRSFGSVRMEWRRREVTNDGGEEGRREGPFAPNNKHTYTHTRQSRSQQSVRQKEVISHFAFCVLVVVLGVLLSSPPFQHPSWVSSSSSSSPSPSSWTATTPPAPPPPHRPLNRRLPHGAPPQRAAGARPADAAPTPGDANGADGASAFALVVVAPTEGREGGSSSSSLKRRETSSSAPLDFELRGSIARLPAKNSSNSSRMPNYALAPGGVTTTKVCEGRSVE